MFEKILVPVDFTDKNKAAVQLAAGLVAEDGQVTLLHVIETISDAPFDELEDFYRRIEERSRREMTALAELLPSEAFTVRQEIIYGHRARQIVSWAERDGSDLLVVSAQQLDPERPREEWLNLSHAVALLARCPVLLVK